MSQAPRVAVIAIEADPRTIVRYAAAGWMPSIAGVIRRSREVEVRTLADLFLTSTWPCFASGVSVANHGIHAFRALRSGTLETVEGSEHRVPTPFWETAVRAGRRACVVDVPICGPPPDDAPLDGLRFLEWGAHPPLREAGSFPPELAPSIVARYGPHPCTTDDPSVSTARALIAMQASLCEGVRLRARILAELLDKDCPDLLVAVFSESHTAGHQFANLEEPGHPWHDPAAARAFGESPFRKVYVAIDAAVGSILALLPPETTVLLTCLGGLRVTYGGSQLLSDLLLRLGLAVAAPHARVRASSFWKLVPLRVREALARRLPARLLVRRSDARFRAAFDWTATRAFALPWAYDGYLRVNQRGREPEGIVAPGAEREAVLGEIESAVRALRIVGTDEPAAVQVVRTQEAFPGRAAEELPDLMVLWNNERPLDAVESPALGRIQNRDLGKRSAHSTRGTIYAYGPGIAQGAPIAAARDIDVAPTVLTLLGLAPPEGLDGRPIAELLTSAALVRG